MLINAYLTSAILFFLKLPFWFNKPDVKHFFVWNLRHLVTWWSAFPHSHITNKIFLNLRPKMLLTGILDVTNRKLILLKRNLLLSSNARVFLLFSTDFTTHALQHDLLCHFTLLYNLIFPSPLRFLLCCKLPPLHHLGTTCTTKNTQDHEVPCDWRWM